MKNKFLKFIRNSRGMLITLLIFALVAVITLTAIGAAGDKVTQEQAQLLRDNLYSAAVSCYAVCGRYPTLEEIQTDYGVVIDETRYDVYYSSFASNIIPTIRVSVRGAE